MRQSRGSGACDRARARDTERRDLRHAARARGADGSCEHGLADRRHARWPVGWLRSRRLRRTTLHVEAARTTLEAGDFSRAATARSSASRRSASSSTAAAVGARLGLRRTVGRLGRSLRAEAGARPVRSDRLPAFTRARAAGPSRRVALALWVVAAVVLVARVAGIVFAGSASRIAAGVTVPGVNVGGLTAEEARAKLASAPASATQRCPVVFTAAEQRFNVRPGRARRRRRTGRRRSQEAARPGRRALPAARARAGLAAPLRGRGRADGRRLRAPP